MHFPSAESWWMYSWLLREKMGNKDACGTDRIVCPAATLSATQCPFNLTVTEPSEKLGSLGNNPGIVLITSRLEPNWIILLTGCLLKDFSTMSTVHIVLGRRWQLCLYCGIVVTECFLGFFQYESHFFYCDGLFFLCRPSCYQRNDRPDSPLNKEQQKVE